ncbi:MAG: hypothetical protein DRP18_05265, partial [Candidatus Aenigmatarchaeota archaeon]
IPEEKWIGTLKEKIARISSSSIKIFPSLDSFISKLNLKPFDLIHAKSLLNKFIKLRTKTEKERRKEQLIIGETFLPSALLTRDERDTQLGQVNYPDIAEAPVNKKKAKEVVATFNPMDGGLGTSVKRERYLKDITGRDKLGAKATDLFFKVKIEAKDSKGNTTERTELLSIAEIKLLRVIKDAENYSSVYFQPLVNKDSAPSYIKLLNSIYFNDRIDDTVKKKRTYLEVMKEKGIRLYKDNDMLYQADLPIIDLEASTKEKIVLTDKFTAPGGHGQWGVRLLYEAVNFHQPKDDKRVYIRAFYNGDGVSNFPDEVIIGWMAKERVPVIMISTTKTGIDKKGGQIGIQILKDGTTKVQMLELAQAKRAGRKHEELFYRIGLEGLEQVKGRRNEPNTQAFNTNIALINYTVLAPLLQEVSKLEDIEYEGEIISGKNLIEKIITPDLIENVKEKEDGKEYTQLEGAIGSCFLNLNAFFATTKDKRIKEILRKNNIDKLLRIVHIPAYLRTRFFTPVKFSWDYWFLAYSDFYKLDTEKWALINTEEGKTPPALNITTYKRDKDGNLILDKEEKLQEEKFYQDVQNCIDCFGNASTKDLTSLTIEGKVAFKDAILRGEVTIISEYPKAVDLNTEEVKKILGQKQDKPLVLDNVKIFISKEGKIKVSSSSIVKRLSS